jgi:hypothetical protein
VFCMQSESQSESRDCCRKEYWRCMTNALLVRKPESTINQQTNVYTKRKSASKSAGGCKIDRAPTPSVPKEGKPSGTPAEVPFRNLWPASGLNCVRCGSRGGRKAGSQVPR